MSLQQSIAAVTVYSAIEESETVAIYADGGAGSEDVYDLG